jgi:hypothetical protein
MTTLRQKTKVGVDGSLMNQLMGNNSTLPKVGEGATIMYYSDRDAYQVTWVSDCGTKCHINRAKMKWVGTSYGDEHYEYEGYNKDNHEVVEWYRGSWCIVQEKVLFEPKFIEMMNKKYNNSFWYDDEVNAETKLMGITETVYNDIVGINEYLNKVIKGVTKNRKSYQKISILFGQMNQYRDPSF